MEPKVDEYHFHNIYFSHSLRAKVIGRKVHAW